MMIPPATPASPRFLFHQAALDCLRRHAVYHWPPDPAEKTQAHLQKRIAEMKRDGYAPEEINEILRLLADLTITEAERFMCNTSRAHFFAELVRTETL